MSSSAFVPRWASPPGDTIRDALAQRNLTELDLTTALGLSAKDTSAVLSGDRALTIGIAEDLSQVVGGTVDFWMARDSQYRADLSRLDADEWVAHLPIADMKSLGWISSEADDWLEEIDECLQFFEVQSVEEWRSVQAASRSHTMFRSSTVHSADDFAVAAWLQQCDRELSELRCDSWDADAFADMLPDLRRLSEIRDPAEFLPRLQADCASVGVAVGVVRAPHRCPISGAAQCWASGQRGIALTARFLADDHLWFTFFHEAAHLLLHDPHTLFVDDIDRSAEPATSLEEQEADEFAGHTLVPIEFESAVSAARREPFKLRRLAHEIGISTGVLVGHLQHKGVVPYRSRLNKLKHRYQWDGPTLGRA